MVKTLKIGITLLVVLCAILVVLIIIDVPGRPGPGEVTEIPGEQTHDPALIFAVESALARAEGHWALLEYQIDSIQFEDHGEVALIWLAPLDPETGELMAREPELAIAVQDQPGQWRVLLEDDPVFMEKFINFQYADINIQGDFISITDAMPKSRQVFGGYYLPWAAGLEKRLTWSVAHSSCNPTHYCTHAFDFADGTMFPLLAAKGGTVFHWRDSCRNNDRNCTNSITLQDRSTDPWTYQIYLHIAHNSVPSELKQVGTSVLQGQFIATVDNTGFSTGHHVHFMVVTERTRLFSSGMQSVWGVAEDITFRDVDINWHEPTQGGRPRLAYEAASYGGQGRTRYVSGNVPAFAPTGGLYSPVSRTYITDRNLRVSGWSDGEHDVVKLELLANFAGTWVQIGEEQTDGTFSTTVDLCNTPVPSGPFSLALRVWDSVGNPSEILTPRKLVKNIECGTSDTNPTVSLVRNEGVLALPQQGFVKAEVTRGRANRAISTVEFWLHAANWRTDDWVYLGKGSAVSGGWQIPIDTVELAEGRNYTILVVATDSAGNKGVDVNFRAVVDRTPPWINFADEDPIISGNRVTFNWMGGDGLSGLSRFSLAVSVNGADFVTIEDYLTNSTRSYTFVFEPKQNLVFALSAFDKAGNSRTEELSMYIESYVFDYQYFFPLFFYND